MNRTTQRAAILRLLIEAHGEWVSLPEIMACAAQYNARIFELRRQGFHIQNRTEIVDDARHSWFRLVASPERKASTRNDAAEPACADLPLFDAAGDQP